MIRFDTILVILIVAAAAFYLLRRFFASSSGAGCSCRCGSARNCDSSRAGCSSAGTKIGTDLPEERQEIEKCSGCGCGGK
ncbi:MAG: hypothetical protein BM485_02705 [Desulfobulbaceae bacterium DB1]|nr:MAG: hypothetical protein BM485_02705 [Desulfobulbaceae bacterium DB1]